MKYLKVIIAIFVIVLVIGIFYFVLRGGDTTGLVVEENLFTLDSVMEEGIKYENPTNITREEALDHLAESEQIIEEMIERGLPFIFMNDTLLEARKIFKQAEYAEILRGEIGVSETKRLEAKKALRLLNWKKITYDAVIVYTNQIKERRDRTFILYDSLIATKISLMPEGSLDTSITGMVSLIEEVNESTGEKVFILDSDVELDEETKELFDEAVKAFYDGREDAEDLLIQLRQHIEAKNLESATANALKNNLKRNWVGVLIFLVTLGLIVYVFYKNVSHRKLGQKIEKMKLEKRAIFELIKKLQQERFKENKISDFVYKIKMKKYKNRSAVINSILPVLESNYKSREIKKVEKDSKNKE
jgi:hypothetical protein